MVKLTNEAGHTAAALIVEVQLREDKRKAYSWPMYIVNLRGREMCPVVLLVICADGPTAAWAELPIETGHPDFVLKPLVIGPEQTPVVTEPELARRKPELAVMSALSHGGKPDRKQVLDSLLAAYSSLGRDEASLYHDIILATLPEAARNYLEGLMAITGYEYQSDFARTHYGRGKAEGKAEGKAQGKAEGEAVALLAVLAARGIEVPPAAEARIVACADLEQLETWIRRAVTAKSIDDLFA